jgi:hypothetical protein
MTGEDDKMGVVVPMPGVLIDRLGTTDRPEPLQPNESLARLLRSLGDMAEEGRITSMALVHVGVDGRIGKYTVNVTDGLVGQIARLEHFAHIELDKAEDTVYRS